LNAINKIGKKYDLSINVSKTKLMIVSRQLHDNAILYINDQPIERTNKFKYLKYIKYIKKAPHLTISGIAMKKLKQERQ